MRNDGLFVGSSAAMNCVGAVKLARTLGPGKRIVTILCDSGQRYVRYSVRRYPLPAPFPQWVKHKLYVPLAYYRVSCPPYNASCSPRICGMKPKAVNCLCICLCNYLRACRPYSNTVQLSSLKWHIILDYDCRPMQGLAPSKPISLLSAIMLPLQELSAKHLLPL